MNIRSVYAVFQSHFRPKRMEKFETRFSSAQRPRVLDIGGTPSIWRFARSHYRVTLLNLTETTTAADNPCVEGFVAGSALALPFADGEFDIAFSNSVIEHVGGFKEQELFASEARRVAPRTWVQTPARWFPVEPHTISIMIHYLPKRAYARLLRWLSVWGWLERPTPIQCRQKADRVRLLTKRQLALLFPDCQIITERFCLLPKAYVVVR